MWRWFLKLFKPSKCEHDNWRIVEKVKFLYLGKEIGTRYIIECKKCGKRVEKFIKSK